MTTLLWAEWTKLRHAPMALLGLLASVMMPLLNLMVYRLQGMTLRFTTFALDVNLLICFLSGTLVYGLFSAWIAYREEAQDMMRPLLSVPLSRVRLLVAKWFVSGAVIFLMTLCALLTCILLSVGFGFSGLDAASVLSVARRYALGALCFWPLQMPFIALSFLSRGILLPLGACILSELVLFLCAQSRYIGWFPWSAPLLFGTDLTGREGFGMQGSPQMALAGAVVVCALSFGLAAMRMRRMEY